MNTSCRTWSPYYERLKSVSAKTFPEGFAPIPIWPSPNFNAGSAPGSVWYKFSYQAPLIETRYSSTMMLSFKVTYVLSFDMSRIFDKDVCWKISFSRSNNCRLGVLSGLRLKNTSSSPTVAKQCFLRLAQLFY